MKKLQLILAMLAAGALFTFQPALVRAEVETESGPEESVAEAMALAAAEVKAEKKSDKRPLALVWRGPGVCSVVCGPSAARAAQVAGFRTRSVYPGMQGPEIDTLLAKAKLWVQPGGKSVTAAAAMGPEFMERIRRFISDGGGYVGFCAGMFIATREIGTSGKEGFGIIPGSTELSITGDNAKMIPLTTIYRGREMFYYAGGPMLHITDEELRASGGKITSWYDDGAPAGIQVPYGRGFVSVVGFHPEASWIWKAFKGHFSRKSQRWLSTEMMRWATTEH